MRYALYILLFLVVSSCKTKSVVLDDKLKDVKKLPARKIVKNHQENIFTSQTIDARLKVQYSDNKNKGRRNRQSLTVRLRMKKDSVIWIKGSKVVSAFRARITPESFSYYSPITKEYFTGDYGFLEQMLGVEVSFDQLQNLFLGQSIWDLKDHRFDSSIEQNAHKLTPKKQKELYSIFFYFYPTNFRLKKQLIVDTEDKMLNITYPGYILQEGEYFPKKIEINASEKSSYTFISVDTRSIEINKPISIPYRIPDGYKELVINK